MTSNNKHFDGIMKDINNKSSAAKEKKRVQMKDKNKVPLGDSSISKIQRRRMNNNISDHAAREGRRESKEMTEKWFFDVVLQTEYYKYASGHSNSKPSS